MCFFFVVILAWFYIDVVFLPIAVWCKCQNRILSQKSVIITCRLHHFSVKPVKYRIFIEWQISRNQWRFVDESSQHITWDKTSWTLLYPIIERLDQTVVCCVSYWPWPRRPCRRSGVRARKEQTPAGGDGGHAARHTEHVNTPARAHSAHSRHFTSLLALTVTQ